MTREFILNTLLPYKEDVSKCAYENSFCKYLTNDGRKCAVGKHLIDGDHQRLEGSVGQLVNKYGWYPFTKEAQDQKINLTVWSIMQRYHDSLSQTHRGSNTIVDDLEKSTGFEFPELRP